MVNLLDQKLANPNPDYFSRSKAALQSATVMLAQAFAPRLRVCGVAPGVTLLSGDMKRGRVRARAPHDAAAARSTPEDIAAAVRYLLGARAVTGTTLLVDGGQHLAAQPRDVACSRHDWASLTMNDLMRTAAACSCATTRCMNIGVHDFEKRGEQRVLINVELYVPLAVSTPTRDEPRRGVDYDFIRRRSSRAWRGPSHLCRRRWPTTCWR